MKTEFGAVMPILISFVISAVLGKWMIPFLHRLKFGQQVRDDGPQAHLKKAGTPTMGGIFFLIAVILTSLLFLPGHPRILPVLLITAGFGLVGFLDDFLKIRKHQSEGLTVKQKLAMQLLFTAAFAAYMVKLSPAGTTIMIPYLHLQWNMGLLYIPFVFVVVLGTDNGTNFTDGLDGLCSSVTIVVAAFLTWLSARYGAGIEPVTGAVIGSLAGFLLYNVYPAKVFMGDTGSLALGAFVAGAACELGQPLIILLIGFIYLVEVLSVMIQVAYFKKTHGKRIFRMAPIHHHFELGGWSETRVVAVFTIITGMLCLIAALGV